MNLHTGKMDLFLILLNATQNTIKVDSIQWVQAETTEIFHMYYYASSNMMFSLQACLVDMTSFF